MENLLDELNSISEKTEKQINIHEDWSMEIIQSQEQREKRCKKNKQAQRHIRKYQAYKYGCNVTAR